MIKRIITYYGSHGLRKTLARSLLELSRRLDSDIERSGTVKIPVSGPDGPELSYTGERVIPEYKNDCFYAHLSIYHFAKDFVQDKSVLDAGCGSGYGTHYLASHGAKKVCGIDISEDAIRSAAKNYPCANLTFIRMDCENIRLDSNSFDVVFSSNMIEHLHDYHSFLRGIKASLRDNGVFILATPPLYGHEAVEDNPFHHTNLTVAEWIDILSGYFHSIGTYLHLFDTNKKNRHGAPYVLDFANRPEDCTIDEKDFYFEKVPESIYRENSETLTALFVLSGKR